MHTYWIDGRVDVLVLKNEELFKVDDIQDKKNEIFEYIYHLCERSWVVSLSSILFRFLHGNEICATRDVFECQNNIQVKIEMSALNAILTLTFDLK